MSLRKLLFLTLVMVITLGTSGCGFFVPSARSIAEHVLRAQAKLNSLYAVWHETKTSPHQKPTTVTVHYWFKKPASFRYLLEKQGSPPLLTICDGHLLWTYNQRGHLYTVTPLPATVPLDPFAVPNSLPGQLRQLLAQNRVSFTGTGVVAGQPVYGLRLSSGGGVTTVWIDRQTFQPISLQRKNSDGSTSSLDYQTFSPNIHLSDSLFHFSPPAGATLSFGPSPFSRPREISLQVAVADSSFRFFPPQAPLPLGMTISKVTGLPNRRGGFGSVTVFLLDSSGNTILVSESAGPVAGAEGPWAGLGQGTSEELNGLNQFHLLPGRRPGAPVILSFLENSTLVIISGAPREEALQIAENLSSSNPPTG